MITDYLISKPGFYRTRAGNKVEVVHIADKTCSVLVAPNVCMYFKKGSTPRS